MFMLWSHCFCLFYRVQSCTLILQVVVTAVSPRLTVREEVVQSLPKAVGREAKTVEPLTTSHLLQVRISIEDPEGITEATTARPEAPPQTWEETCQASLVSILE